MKKCIVATAVVALLFMSKGVHGAEIGASFQKNLDEFSIKYENNLSQKYSWWDGVNVRGYTSFDKREIVIDDSMNLFLKDYVLNHEMGHVLDLVVINGFDHPYYNSVTPEFQAIFKEERNNMKEYTSELYFTEDIHEYFAESFALYIKKPKLTKELAPLTYDYIDNLYTGGKADNEQELK